MLACATVLSPDPPLRAVVVMPVGRTVMCAELDPENLADDRDAFQRSQAAPALRHHDPRGKHDDGISTSIGLNGAAWESNPPSDGLRRLTGFEDRLGHRAPPLRLGL
jgi:hypothetical protein